MPVLNIIKKPIVHIITPRRMDVKQNPTNALNAQNRSPIHRTSPSIHAFTWALNHIVAKYANANLPSCHICNSTYARIRAINPTNVVMPVVRRPSHSSPISSPTRGAIKRTNPLNAIHATNALPMK